jgi:hypothetical protein
MKLIRECATAVLAAGAVAVVLVPPAGAATDYQLTPIPPIGTVYANNIVTLGVTVGPVPVGADASTPVVVTVTEPDGDVHTSSVSLTLGLGTVATRLHEDGRYTARFEFDPPGGNRAEATVQFDAVPSPLSLS